MNENGVRYLAVALVVGAVIAGCAWSRRGLAEFESNTNIVQLSSASFQKQVLAAPQPVLVDFWAPWCQPCRQLAPTISQLADEYQGRVLVGTVNIDDEYGLAEKYNIEGIPAVLIFTNGVVAHQLPMWREKKEYQDLLNALVPPAPVSPTQLTPPTAPTQVPGTR